MFGLTRRKRPAGQLVNGTIYRPQAELTLGRPITHDPNWTPLKREEYRNIEFWCRRNAAPRGCAYVRAEDTPAGWVARYVAPAQGADRLYRVVMAANARVVELSADYEIDKLA